MRIEINLKIILAIILFFLIENLNTYFIFLIFIIVHELAHLIVGILIGGTPNKMTISIFGVSLEFYSYGKNKVIYKILFFSIGPIINLSMAILYYIVFKKNDLIVQTNLAIGIFNLLPILPLDGGKIVKEIARIFVENEKAVQWSLNVGKIFLVLISSLYSVLILKIKNIMILMLIIYLWYIYNIEERKYMIYQKTNECIKNRIKMEEENE